MTQNSVIHSLLTRIQSLHAHRDRVIVGVDGRCASGKTTLSASLSETLGCPVIHMDQFFLRPHMRTPERLALPGGNVDKERFLEEVAKPLKATDGSPFSYRPFNCHTGNLEAPIVVPYTDTLIIEGTYSLSPELRSLYDVRVFLTIDPAVQLKRIEARNGSTALEAFRSKWIPLEEAYFEAFRPWEDCEFFSDTTE